MSNALFEIAKKHKFNIEKNSQFWKENVVDVGTKLMGNSKDQIYGHLKKKISEYNKTESR